MTKIISYYDPNTGAFTTVMGGKQAKETPNSVYGAYNNHYMDLETGVIHPKKQFPFGDSTIAADGVDSFTAEIPNSTKVIITKDFEVVFNDTIDDGELNFTTDEAGVYEVKLKHPHYEKYQFVIKAE